MLVAEVNGNLPKAGEGIHIRLILGNCRDNTVRCGAGVYFADDVLVQSPPFNKQPNIIRIVVFLVQLLMKRHHSVAYVTG